MNKLFYLFLLAIVVASCSKDEGTITVTYQEATAIYGDIESIRATVLQDVAQPIVDPGKIFVGEDFILVGEEEKGIHIITNQDSEAPQHMGFLNIPGNREYYVHDHIIYAESYYDVVKIDISNLAQAQLVDRAEFVFQDEWKNDQGETLIGFSFEEKTVTLSHDDDFTRDVIQDNVVYYDFARNIIPKSAVPASFAGNAGAVSGTINRVNYSEGHVYIVGQSSMKVIRDDGNSLTIVHNPQLDLIGEGLETVYPHDDYLFVGSRSAMDVYNISDASHPQHHYEFEHATSCDPVYPVDEVVYITLRTAEFSACPGNINALLVLDISDMNDIDEKKEIEMQSPYGMTMIDDKLYVGEGKNGLKIFDAHHRLEPTLILHDSAIPAYDIIAHPSRPGTIFVTGPQGIRQYTQDVNTDDLTLQHTIDF